MKTNIHSESNNAGIIRRSRVSYKRVKKIKLKWSRIIVYSGTATLSMEVNFQCISTIKIGLANYFKLNKKP